MELRFGQSRGGKLVADDVASVCRLWVMSPYWLWTTFTAHLWFICVSCARAWLQGQLQKRQSRGAVQINMVVKTNISGWLAMFQCSLDPGIWRVFSWSGHERLLGTLVVYIRFPVPDHDWLEFRGYTLYIRIGALWYMNRFPSAITHMTYMPISNLFRGPFHQRLFHRNSISMEMLFCLHVI